MKLKIIALLTYLPSTYIQNTKAVYYFTISKEIHLPRHAQGRYDPPSLFKTGCGIGSLQGMKGVGLSCEVLYCEGGGGLVRFDVGASAPSSGMGETVASD